MRQILSIAFLCAIITLVGCTDEVTQDVVQSYVKQNTTSPLTRTASLDVSVDTTTQELQETEDLKVLRSKCRKAHSVLKRVNMMSDDEYDDTYWSNMYAIRELPSTIKVRSIASSGSTYGYTNLYCDRKGGEVTLNNRSELVNNRFYIRILPASSGIPYLIYSAASKTPLTVGHYRKNPNEKILMARTDENGSLYGASWDLLSSEQNHSYYSIQSNDYFGQTDPNSYWTIYHYVLEAVSGNKIRYAKRVLNKSQQEFIITPDQKFDIVSLEYDVENASVSKTSFTKTMTTKNLSSQDKDINVAFNFYENENSFFNKNKWNVNLQFSNNEINFPRPSVVGGYVISPDGKSSDARFMYNGYQNISRKITYSYPIRCKASSVVKVTLTFVKYNVTVKYTAKAQCTIDGNVRECILKGTWTGSIVEDPNEIKPEGTIQFSPIGDGDIPLE